MTYTIPYTVPQILNALDCCMERPNRDCRKCPLFKLDGHKECDHLEWYAWCVIMNQRKEIEELKANLIDEFEILARRKDTPIAITAFLECKPYKEFKRKYGGCK